MVAAPLRSLRDCYTVSQAARRLRVSPWTVRGWAKAGYLPGAAMVLGRAQSSTATMTSPS